MKPIAIVAVVAIFIHAFLMFVRSGHSPEPLHRVICYCTAVLLIGLGFIALVISQVSTK